jgi:chemotaxis protein methyltransferase CheR
MPLSSVDFDYVRALVRQRSAIVLDSEKVYRADTCLLPLARQEGLGSVEDLVARLRGTPVNGLHLRVVEAMTINETSFFRDLYPFEALRREVLPEIIRRRASERLDIWCAACSTGQEPYSVAMLLREHFPAFATWKVRLLASDLSSAVLERARAGRYNQLEVNRGLPAPLLIKYFQRQGVEWQLKDDVRRMVDFCSINLIESWPVVGSVDVVFLRNVLIYFDVETKKRILDRLHALLRPGGVLFLGGAETTLQLCNGFERVSFERQSYYRVREN